MPGCTGPCGSWRPGKRRWRFGLPNFARSGRHSSPSLPGFERSGRRCRSRCPLQTPISAGPCEGRGARRPRSSRCPGRTPGCARARRRHGTGSRRWKPSLRGFARPERCCRERSTAARASSRTNRARSVSAASSTARPAHGRTQRPGLEERTEEYNPPPDACVCGRCGQPYAPNGAEESTLVEIEVKAHKRVIRRSRWRRACECASSPMEVSARPVPRLFPQDALRDQLLGALPVRALCLLPPPAPGCRVVLQPGAAGLAGDPGRTA